MCKKLKRKNLFKRFVLWLAWLVFKPKCKTCEEADTCVYNTIMTQRDEGV